MSLVSEARNRLEVSALVQSEKLKTYFSQRFVSIFSTKLLLSSSDKFASAPTDFVATAFSSSRFAVVNAFVRGEPSGIL